MGYEAFFDATGEKAGLEDYFGHERGIFLFLGFGQLH